MDRSSSVRPTSPPPSRGVQLTLPVGWFPIDPTDPARRAAQIRQPVERLDRQISADGSPGPDSWLRT